jgi:hypothetical protein
LWVDKESKKIVLSVLNLKDKDEQEVNDYVAKFKLKKFTLGDVIDRTRNLAESKEEVDFKIDDVIKEEVKEKKE